MYAADTASGQRFAIGFVDKNAVCGNYIGAKDTEFVEILHRRHSILL